MDLRDDLSVNLESVWTHLFQPIHKYFFLLTFTLVCNGSSYVDYIGMVWYGMWPSLQPDPVFNSIFINIYLLISLDPGSKTPADMGAISATPPHQLIFFMI